MELKTVIGQNIVKLRKMQRTTQQELAYRAEISVSHLRNIEQGQANTTIDILERLSKSLGVAPTDLFNK